MRSIVGSSLESRRLVAGEKIVLGRFVHPSASSRPDQVILASDGPANSARVALRTDDQLLGLISVDMLPTDRAIDDDQVAALLLLAEHLASTIARARAISAFNEAAVSRAVEQAELEAQAREVVVRHEIDRLKSEFLLTLSHELRTSLSLIRGYAEVLSLWAERFSPDETRQIADDVLAASETLNHLVDGLFDLSPLEHGAIQVHPRRVGLAPFLRSTADAARNVEANERLVVELPDALPARADPERTCHAGRHLLTNAFRYAPEGFITLKAGRAPGRVWIEVIDQGPGIPPEERDRIWEKFYRGASAAGYNRLQGG